jgi:mono/diheme cytochrome c family protein
MSLVASRNLLRYLLLPLGFALILISAVFKEGTAAIPQATPTLDRLAEPTLPVSPLQADQGAQVYWLSCLPCHGDRGQGLTDEFRQTYPPEDRNCWNSGCHGRRPYNNGFTLPASIPAVIGPGTLQKFPNATVLHAYILAAMPFWKPGSLTDEQSWQVTAFILRENGIYAARDEITASDADRILISGPRSTSTPQPVSSTAMQSYLPFMIGFVVLILLLLLQRILSKK